MNEKTKTGLEILQAALLLGILADLLLRPMPWGIGASVWLCLFLAGILTLTCRRKSSHLNARTIPLYGAMLIFSLTFVWRDSTELTVFSSLAIAAILAVQVMPALKIEARLAGVFNFFIAGSWAVICVVFGPLMVLAGDIKWKTLPNSSLTKHIVSGFKGLAIGLPIFLLFGLLFMAADAAFEGLVQNTLRIDIEEFILHVVFISFGIWIVAGYLRASIIDVESNSPDIPHLADDNKPAIPSVTDDISSGGAKNEGPGAEDENPEVESESWDWRRFDNSFLPDFLKVGAIETGIVLGLINLLFLVFVIVQLPYLFGGMDLVRNTADFKLAEYARRGFGELIAVASLVLPILLTIHWLLRKDNPFNEKLFRILAGIQIGLLFVIMSSAMQRLVLLTGNLGYGLTVERFYAMSFIVLLAMIFIVFGLTVLRGLREQFAWGALWSGLLMLAALHLMNPDDFIARTNIRLMQEGRNFDADYNRKLSDDAVPVLLESIPLMDYQNRLKTHQQLRVRFCRSKNNRDIRSSNRARSTAQAMLQNVPEIAGTDCAEVDRGAYDHSDF